MSDEGSGFSGVTIVIFIACGVLTFFLLLLLSKRSITRFALKNRRGPHVPVGYNAPKNLRREIENRLNRIPELSPEPKSLLADRLLVDFTVDDRLKTTCHFYRMKAVDAIKAFEYNVREKYPNVKRRYNEPLRNYLLNSLVGASPGGKKVKLVHKVCDVYDHARHDPRDFTEDNYGQFVVLIQELQQWLDDN
ncbi:hypothetical protein CHUAL_011028 [Chamberlinius hualienensis]